MSNDVYVENAVLKSRIARAADQTNSVLPDSLGDRLVRCSIRTISKVLTQADRIEMNALLAEFSDTRFEICK